LATALRVVVLFAVGLLLRVLFQAATPDGGPCWHVGFQGDAPAWMDLAGKIANGIPDGELTIPWRPPAMIQGLAFLWDGEGATVWRVRLLFIVLGAAVAPLLWLWLRRHVAAPIAWFAAVVCATASNLLLLSSGLHVETLYLVGVLLTLFDQDRLASDRWRAAAGRWGVLHGLLCLARAEHLAVAVVLLAIARRRGARWGALALALVAFAAPLVPWQLHVNRRVEAFQAGEPPLPAVDVAWQDDALAKLRELPAFAQRWVFDFVSATMQVRGRDTVRTEDLAVVRDAYGCYPEAVRPAFVALQGGFSFWLACTPESDGGHSRLGLDRPPPLTGGDHLYPPNARTLRPRGGAFQIEYPPHADVFVHGYRRGFAELAADPLGALLRVGKKLVYAIEGATGGVGGYALPIGVSGVRPPVDMVVATGVWPTIWRALVLAVAVAGLWRLRRERALWPLLAYAAMRLLLLLAFFGHARHGALLLPVVALGVASTLHAATAARWPRVLPWLAAALLVALPALELVRSRTTTVAIDGRAWLGSAGGRAEYDAHTITFH
jgi:hypothetical protein